MLLRHAAIADLYEQRFGPLVELSTQAFFPGERPYIDDDSDDDEKARVRAAWDAAPRFAHFLCWDRVSPGAAAVCGSLGGADLPSAHEIFIVMPVPVPAFTEMVIGIIGSRTTPLRALEVVSAAAPDTHFEAVLLAPVEDGLVLGVVDGTVRHALRAIPLTRAERGLAEDDPLRALTLLREAGGFVAHPFRDCLLEPERTRARRVRLEWEMSATTGRRYYTVIKNRDKIRQMSARYQRELRGDPEEEQDEDEAEEIRAETRRYHLPGDMLDDADQMVAERHALLMYLDGPVDDGGSSLDRHVPYALHRAVPPDPRRVALRAQIHAGIGLRRKLERGTMQGGERLRHMIMTQVGRAGLRAELEPHEAALFEAPVGSLGEQALARVRLHGAALVILAWALHVVDLPAHDEKGAIGDMFPLPGQVIPELASPTLRSLDERVAYLNRAHALAWRIHMQVLDPRRMDVLAAARSEGFWFGSLSFDGIPLVSGDVAVDGRPIHEAPPERVKLLRSIAFARLHAASWLVGLHPLYSEAPAGPW